MADNKIEVFICYAHKDEGLMRDIERQLNVLAQQGLITLWHDRMIAGGKDWKQEVNKHLNAAQIILLLVSADFMFSEYSNIEVKRAMERHKAGEAQVIPVILRYVGWRGSSFGELIPFPKDGKPVTSFASRDQALFEVVEGVEKAVKELRKPVVPIAAQSGSDATQSSSTKEQQPMTQNAKDKEFDVFLCHNNKDKAEVKKIGEELKRRGIKPWLDEWELQPGLPWQRALEAQIEQIRSAAVFVGKDGVGPWQNMELDGFLSEFNRRGCPVIPVMLASAPDKPQLPLFLRNMTWVDFRKQEPDPMKQLIWGITSKKTDTDESKDATHPSSVSQPPATPRASSLSFTKKAELVNDLLACSCISNRDSRETVLGLLNEQFPGIANGVSRRTDSQADVMEVVSTCLRHPGSLQELVGIVTYFEGETSINTQQLRTFMQNNRL